MSRRQELTAQVWALLPNDGTEGYSVVIDMLLDEMKPEQIEAVIARLEAGEEA